MKNIIILIFCLIFTTSYANIKINVNTTRQGTDAITVSGSANNSLTQDRMANWNLYQNAKCGYEIKVPSTTINIGAEAASFYNDLSEIFDDDLPFDKECVTAIDLPVLMPNTNLDGKTLLIFVLNSKWSPKGTTINIGGRKFYKSYHSVAGGMNHNYDVYSYSTKYGNKYYMLGFVLCHHDFGVGDEKYNFNLGVESKNFDDIVSTFKIN